MGTLRCDHGEVHFCKAQIQQYLQFPQINSHDNLTIVCGALHRTQNELMACVEVKPATWDKENDAKKCGNLTIV
jgi:N-acetylglutamate synthase-like GNAT family acetyltransferase